MTKERDNQRSKVFKAEDKARKGDERPLPKVDDIERYLTRNMGRKTLERRYGETIMGRMTKVADGRGTRHALAYGGYKIGIPLWARSEWVVLHEMAHIIHSRINGAKSRRQPMPAHAANLVGGASHGWQFCAIFVDLVRYCCGAEAAEKLKTEFKAGKVRYKKPRTVEADSSIRIAA